MAMTVYRGKLNLTDRHLSISLQETLDVDNNCDCCNTSWKNALDSEYDRLLYRNIHININITPSIPFLKTKPDGRLKDWLCYPVNKINLISLLEGENCINCNNKDYCINSTNLVPTCNDFLLTYFFDHEDEDNNTSFSLLTVSNVILDYDYNSKLCY